QFHWDFDDAAPERCGCWVRMMQSWAGAGFGSMVLPRAGMEVLIDFELGDLDRPFAVGCVYNGANRPPYALPEDSTKTALRTRSCPDTGGYNEICFEDEAGKEEILLRGERNIRTTTKADAFLNVGQDQKIEVERNRSVCVNGCLTDIVKKNATYEVWENHEFSVWGDQTQTMWGNKVATVEWDLTHTTRGNKVTSVEGNLTQTTKGDKETTVEKNLTQTTKGEHKQENKKDLHIDTDGSTVIKSKKDTKIKSDGGIKIISSGGEIRIFSPKKITIESPEGVDVVGLNQSHYQHMSFSNSITSESASVISGSESGFCQSLTGIKLDHVGVAYGKTGLDATKPGKKVQYSDLWNLQAGITLIG
ncbi:MAG: phage baseplate assembly protein V, partial [Myxococcota bacterium]